MPESVDQGQPSSSTQHNFYVPRVEFLRIHTPKHYHPDSPSTHNNPSPNLVVDFLCHLAIFYCECVFLVFHRNIQPGPIVKCYHNAIHGQTIPHLFRGRKSCTLTSPNRSYLCLSPSLPPFLSQTIPHLFRGRRSRTPTTPNCSYLCLFPPSPSLSLSSTLPTNQNNPHHSFSTILRTSQPQSTHL